MPPPGGGAKILVIGWLKKKNDDLLKKNAHIRGKMWKKGVNMKFSTVLGGENIIYEMRGGLGLGLSLAGGLGVIACRPSEGPT